MNLQNFSSQLSGVVNQDDLIRRLIQIFKDLEIGLNSQVNVYYISQASAIKPNTYKAGDIVIDAITTPGFIVIYEFDGKTKIPLANTAVESTISVHNERPADPINGVNHIYNTARRFLTGSTRVYLNRQRQLLGSDYTEDTTTLQKINFVAAPAGGSSIVIDYGIKP